MRGGSAAGRALVDVDPERYGTLSHPGDPGSFEIFGQAARAVGPERARQIEGDVDPLGGLEVHRLVATGGSQSAMRLVAYVNGVHRLHGLFDGFLLSVWEGRAPRLDEGPIGVGGVRTRIRTDIDVPVLVVNSEFETTATAALSLPDTENLRLWEVAGTPHGASRRTAGTPDARGAGVGDWVPNRLSWAPVHEAALRQMQRWLVEGVPAPAQPRIEIDPGPPLRVARDGHGNARGGIRLPELAAPVAEYRGMAFGTGRPPLFGACRLFTPEVLRSLYPDRRTFAERWVRAVDDLERTGALRPEDASSLRSQAPGLAESLPVD